MVNNYSYNFDVVIEWIKLLNYRMLKDKKVVYELYKKNGKELTIDELDTLKKYKENKRYIVILKKYQNHQCNEQEYIDVYNLIQKSIINEILNELNKEELIKAREKINSCFKLPSEDLNKILVDMKKDILELSITDMYVLNVIMDVNFTHNLSEINKIK